MKPASPVDSEAEGGLLSDRSWVQPRPGGSRGSLDRFGVAGPPNVRWSRTPYSCIYTRTPGFS
eukprot:scaffold472908_cov18-Prasinocladus_malaysianus.AAC.1